MNLIKKIKWIFFDCPKTAAEWAEQNENRITSIGNFLIFITSVYILLSTVVKSF